jgi:hypothetical protein
MTPTHGGAEEAPLSVVSLSLQRVGAPLKLDGGLERQLCGRTPRRYYAKMLDLDHADLPMGG